MARWIRSALLSLCLVVVLYDLWTVLYVHTETGTSTFYDGRSEGMVHPSSAVNVRKSVVVSTALHPNKYSGNNDKPGFYYNLTSEYERLYTRIRSHVENTGKFPWHLVNKTEIFAKSGILEYTDQDCVRGDPFNPLGGYENPCWETRTPLGGTELSCMPSFYVAGFPKCGTTDLYQSLITHHNIVPARGKEPDFWTKHNSKNFKHYVDKFANVASNITSAALERGGRKVPLITLDGSPSIIWRPSSPGSGSENGECCDFLKFTAPFRILALNPRAKIVLILRNPTERTLSHYVYMNKRGTDKEMYYAMKTAADSLTTCFQQLGVRHCVYMGYKYERSKRPVLLRAGIYYMYIKDLLDLYPRDQVHVIKGEEYYGQRDTVLDHVFNFLNVGPILHEAREGLLKKYVGNRRKEETFITEVDGGIWTTKTRDLLHQFFYHFNIKLSDLLNDKWFLSYNDKQ